ncbi:hypothetical protein DENSPDRAFT_877716 [Dentipellis sp. KUC8613]|nr:hypothetical protein DENSPDRAFT_877716 [Dentipellis sp. KUC8613]
MSTNPAPSSSPQGAHSPQPRIPEKYIDVPSQRLYALSFGLLLQAIKAFDFIRYLFSGGHDVPSYGRKWFLVDFLYFLALAYLRIPRLDYAKSVVVLQIILLWVLDGLLFGGIELHLFGGSGVSDQAVEYSVPATSSMASALLSLLTAGYLFNNDAIEGDGHLLGQHTVRMSPISTAHLNPFGQTHCLASPSSHILIPVLLNNSNPSVLKYKLTPLGGSAKVEEVTLTARDLKAIESARQEALQLVKTTAHAHDTDDYDYDEYDDEEDSGRDSDHTSATRLQKSQSLVYIRLSKPGTVHLEQVSDSTGVEARLIYPAEATVAPCPRAQFVDDDVITRGDNVRCAAPGSESVAGDDRDLQLGLKIFGVPPLSLKWYKEINGRREYFVVEGIEGSHTDNHGSASPAHSAPQDIHVPLTVSADALGTHVYVLEAVTDALGNIEYVGFAASAPSTVATRHSNSTFPANVNTKASRVLHVLKRPAVSFKNCGPDRPASLRMGSSVNLIVSASVADPLDGPWDITMNYQPSLADSDSERTKKFKPRKQTLRTPNNSKEVVTKTDIPGEYTIVGVRGKYCEGDVLSPDVCAVVELPKPSAEIEWRRIHECSGDTGVTASLVLHGTPPFHVYYRTQRNKEHARELIQTFHSSRGEVTLQPPQSGHYVYSFSHISDANYKKVELKGPSIDQIVHPLASASFVSSGPPGRDKLAISSCSGDTVDVEVKLQGTGPWTLEAQLVAPKETKTVFFDAIETEEKTLQFNIPKSINQNGGTFEIDLVSVEDSSGCKKFLSVPGVSVNVKRTKPTARFYSHSNKRQITILENETANLPMRLTGDAPWRIQYRRTENPDQIQYAILHSPNDNLRVRQRGEYEIVDVSDALCPGMIVKDESTYRVDWVPRPSAQLSATTEAKIEPYNGSYILPPICEGQAGHVDLDLTGRPPFQIMYNIARASETGGTRLLDQPTFNSIQPRTRFQLHTSEPGRIYYEVKQIGDAAYPLSANKAAIIPRSDRPLFEQEVLLRPSARFRTRSRLSFCLHHDFIHQDKTSPDGVVVLEGTPPFELKLSVQSLAENAKHVETVTVMDRVWKMELPSYKFSAVGQHLINIESVRDASHCEETLAEPGARSIWVDVAESAAIVPLDNREHFCVGDTTQFQLQGIPPWKVGYEVNGKPNFQEVKSSPFAIVQHQRGEFKVTSVAHQQAMCKSSVTDLRYTVHPLPSAQVGQGKRIIQDIHEGDQAEIRFTLQGEPPFTFAYQRSEPSHRKGGKPGKVLETHTVSGVWSKEYSVFSAMEGTWTVTFISDRYCRYPPNQPDAAAEKA